MSNYFPRQTFKRCLAVFGMQITVLRECCYYLLWPFLWRKLIQFRYASFVWVGSRSFSYHRNYYGKIFVTNNSCHWRRTIPHHTIPITAPTDPTLQNLMYVYCIMFFTVKENVKLVTWSSCLHLKLECSPPLMYWHIAYMFVPRSS